MKLLLINFSDDTNLHKNFRFYARLNKNQDYILSLKAKAVMTSQPAAQFHCSTRSMPQKLKAYANSMWS